MLPSHATNTTPTARPTRPTPHAAPSSPVASSLSFELRDVCSTSNSSRPSSSAVGGRGIYTLPRRNEWGHSCVFLLPYLHFILFSDRCVDRLASSFGSRDSRRGGWLRFLRTLPLFSLCGMNVKLTLTPGTSAADSKQSLHRVLDGMSA